MPKVQNPNIVLKAENLKLGYQKGNAPLIVAENISFELEKGKLTCLLGPNGVGKSTLLKAIMGHNMPLAGELFFEGINLNKFSRNTLAKNIAVVLTEKVSTGNLTVAQLVALGRIPHTGWLGNLAEGDLLKVEQAIAATQIGYLHDRRLSELSDGQLQKVMITRALAQDGEVLILDEPTAHLDLINRFEIMQLLRSIAVQQNRAALVVTHDLEIAMETADLFWIMQCGYPLTVGTPEDLIMDGRINLLLPNEKLTFDILSGKVQEARIFAYPKIEGPEKMVKWVKMALRKIKLQPEIEHVSIRIKENPISFILTNEKGEYSFQTIGELIGLLKNEETLF